ncbi:hypothetical protein [Burkholderia gladioli]|uniref:hypothetical protein n=1 Tax=Burkholderia gladioli TaxID=28095 RepID=UPI000F528D54|nr:hypothetical protein [Burkholderia gladioli]
MKNRKPTRTNLSCLFSLVVLGVTPVAMADPAPGVEVTFPKFHGNVAFDSGFTKRFYWGRNGDDGTYWVWRIAESYPEQDFFCAPNGVPSCSTAFSVTKTITTTYASNFGLSFSDKGVGFTTSFSPTYSTADAKSWTKTVTIKPGWDAHAYLLHAEKTAPNGWFQGAWLYKGQQGSPFGPTTFKYQWSPNTTGGPWSAIVYRAQQFGYCVNKSSRQFNTGDVLVGSNYGHECAPPQYPGDRIEQL